MDEKKSERLYFVTGRRVFRIYRDRAEATEWAKTLAKDNKRTLILRDQDHKTLGVFA